MILEKWITTNFDKRINWSQIQHEPSQSTASSILWPGCGQDWKRQGSEFCIYKDVPTNQSILWNCTITNYFSCMLQMNSIIKLLLTD